ncbi:MAG TPA: endonuclease domain-containing protein [Devosia sp.]|jgi:very-short-patch-repair endonuclease|uniref:endonuclease domain-containing protein n=1 Tax=Devosia sp. TaxID=1871048 RepID=UPI002DDD2F09|nr:endonuclease domain-containing protein [Devosia sp.]HEV2514753.1 endonuclease domain-containing protein [Devosia sp.]
MARPVAHPSSSNDGPQPPEASAAGTNRARALRRNETQAEARLWYLLRDRRLVGFKFRRQVPIGPYFADFACYEGRLVVELDGSQHFESARDVRRDEELRRRGFEVLRVWNSELSDNRDGVLEAILTLLTARVAPPSSGLRPPSPIKGEGHPADIAAQGQPADPGVVDQSTGPSVGPSPLVGEGAQRADEGEATR